jgi:beta-glucosidase
MISRTKAQEVDSVDRRWEDTTLSVAERVEELLRRMTLAEKVAQIGSRWIGHAFKTSALT